MARIAGAARPPAPPRPGAAGGEAVLVLGVHRAELAFGDRVAEGLARGPCAAALGIYRIPQGIRRARTAPGARFRSLAEHREIYLQLAQQIGRHPALLLDLHCGVDETRGGADLFCHDPGFLRGLDARLAAAGRHGRVRLLRIVGEDEPAGAAGEAGFEGAAHTWIPRAVWAAPRPLYVGLEVYLAAEGAGEPADWAFARRLIAEVLAVGPAAGGGAAAPRRPA